MRFLLFAFLLSIAGPAMGQQTDDEAMIFAAIDRWDRAWQIKDPALGAQDYSDNADWTNAFGMRREGRAAIRATLAEVFALPFVAAGTSETQGHSVRFLGADAALVLTRVERAGQYSPSGEGLGERRTSHLRVFEKQDGQWRIVAHLISDARDTESPMH